MPPPCGAGACWYWPAKLYSPIPGINQETRRIFSRVANGWRPARNANELGPMAGAGDTENVSRKLSFATHLTGARNRLYDVFIGVG